METTSKCPECGNPLAGDAPEALCPRCLLQQGLATETVTAGGLFEGRTGKPEVPGYELQDRLGRGAFGEVWSAVQASTRQKVAVKILRQARADFAYLEREVSRLGSVAEHPNVVTLLDANLEHSPPYLVTPLLAGSLQSHVGEAADNLRQVTTWFEQMARALQYVHGKGILHCDLKPANLLLDDEGAIRVVDFGQAHVLGEDELRLGTLWYMSPEQADVPTDGKADIAPDISWDIYSLGATMYQILTGRLPRATDEARQAIGAEKDTLRMLRLYHHTLLRTPLVPIRKLNPRVDQDLACIVERCLEAEAASRHQNMGEILEELRRRREKFPLLARRRTPGYVLERFVARYPIPVAAALVLVTVLGVLFTVARDRIAAARDRERQARSDARVGVLEFERGFSLVAQDHPEGLLWLARAAGDTPSSSVEYRMAARNLLRGRPRLLALIRPFEARGVDHGPERCLFVACFSPDGRKILTAGVTGGIYGTARVWKAEDGTPVTPPLRTEDNLGWASFSPDGQRVLTFGDRGASLWDATSGQRITGLRVESNFFLALLSPDGLKIWTTAEDQFIRFWDAATGRLLLQSHQDDEFRTESAAYSPDGRRIVTTSRKTMRVWDTASGSAIGPPIQHPRYPEGFSAASFSPDGRRILTYDEHGFEGSVLVWDSATGKLLNSIGSHVTFASFTPHGSILTISNHTAELWDDNGRSRTSFSVSADVNSGVFSPDGRWFLTPGPSEYHWGKNYYTGPRTVHVFNMGLRERDPADPLSLEQVPSAAIHPIEHPLEVVSASFSPDGRKILTVCRDNTVRIWEFSPLPEPSTYGAWGAWTQEETGANSRWGGFSQDFSRAFTLAEQTVQIWNTATGKPVTPPLKYTDVPFQHPAWPSKDGARGSEQLHKFFPQSLVSLSPDGRRLVTFGPPLLRTVPRKPLQVGLPSAGNAWVEDDPFDNPPNGPPRWVVHALPDGSDAEITGYRVRFWDATTGERVVPSAGDPILPEVDVAIFNSDGSRCVTVSREYSDTGRSQDVIRIWDVARGRLVAPPIGGDHPESVPDARLDVHFSPDGLRLLTADAAWDARTGQRLVSPPPGNDTVWPGTDQPNSLTDSLTGAVARLRDDNSLTSASRSPDGTRLVTAAKDGTARVWDASTGRPLTPPMAAGGVNYHPSEGGLFSIASATFTTNGRWIITRSGDCKFSELWDAADGKTLTGRMENTVISPDGRWIFTGPSLEAFNRYEHGNAVGTLEGLGMSRLCIAADEDEPAELVELRAEIWTGLALDPAGVLQALDPDTFRDQRSRYEEESAQHAKVCKFPEANLWLQEHSEQRH